MTEPLPAYSRLPLSFDAPQMQAELARLPEQAWQAHFNTGYFTGDWSGIALLAPPSATPSLLIDSQGAAAEPTAVLLDFPFWQQVFQRLPCTISSARLLRLGPGAQIREHCDPDLGRPDGDLRLHLPILSHPAVEFMLEGQTIPMQAGEAWFLDLNRPHRVTNPSEQTRVHLVLDCQRNAWLLQQIANGLPSTPLAQPARGSAQFAAFRALVQQDPTLLEQLVELEDPQQFAETAVALAASLALYFTVDDVQAAMRQGRRAWIEQWVI